MGLLSEEREKLIFWDAF